MTIIEKCDERVKTMTIISVREAENSLAELIERASKGETIFIGERGRVEAALTAVAKGGPQKKRLGLLADKLTVPDDFDAPLPPDILAAFEGKVE